MRPWGWRWVFLWMAITPAVCGAEAISLLEGGHVKARSLSTLYPDDSVYREQSGGVDHSQGGSLRLVFGANAGAWRFNADYQVLGRFNAPQGSGSGFDAQLAGGSGQLDDDRRLLDLSTNLDSGGATQVQHRLDRLNIDYSSGNLVLRMGRQAVSWGNGLIYTPMDFFNPFDPTAIDTEYKTGDDMLYGQYLLDNGNDWQLVTVARRDEKGDVSADAGTVAVKFHGFGRRQEFDLLLAEHYDDLITGVGGSASVGGAVVRADLTYTDTPSKDYVSLVANWSRSFVWAGHNVSATAEYFYSGIGLEEGDYGKLALQRAPALSRRLERGELFTVGRHYMAGSLLIEVTPLLQVTPTAFVNLGDESVLLQANVRWDLAQDWRALFSLSVPLGSQGTEFGGVPVRPGRYASLDGALLAQIAWYF